MTNLPTVTADRKPDTLPTTTTGAPMAHLPPGPLPDDRPANTSIEEEQDELDEGDSADTPVEGDSMEVDQAAVTA